MNGIGLPDLLSNTRISRSIGEVNADLSRASQELTTGRKSDLVAATGGDPTRLFSLERDLSLNATRRDAIDLAIGRSGVSQSALAVVQGSVADFGPRLAGAVAIGDLSAAERIGAEARASFEQSIAALNSRFGDRSVFAGAATDGPTTATADVILAEVAAVAAAAPDAASAITAVGDYFNDPAGFLATGYLGSTSDAPAAEIADGERLDYAVRGDREEIRDALAALALAVVGVEGGFPGETRETRLDFLNVAAERATAAEGEVIDLRSEIGVAEERLEQASVRASAEDAFLQQARNRIVQRDQFEAATEFTTLETQLQMVFSVTARLSSLTLTNFLR